MAIITDGGKHRKLCNNASANDAIITENNAKTSKNIDNQTNEITVKTNATIS